MFPVIKSDYWSSKGDESQPARIRQETAHASVVYAPIPQNAVPLMYSTAPVTIHHAPHSTYNNNNNANPSVTYVPFLDQVPPPPPLPPPPPYDSEQPHSSLEYTTVYDKPALDGATAGWDQASRLGTPEADRKRKREGTALERRAGVQHQTTKPLFRRFKKSADRGDVEKSKIESGLMELTPLKSSAIIETFEEIEDGLTVSLQKEHSRTAKNLLKCGRLSVRTLKRLLIALVAVSAVYTAGTQLFDGTKLDEFATGILALVFPSSNSTIVTSALNATQTPSEWITDRELGAGKSEETSTASARFTRLNAVRPLGESNAQGPEKPNSPFKIDYVGVFVGGVTAVNDDGGATGTGADVVTAAATTVTDPDFVEVVTDAVTVTAITAATDVTVTEPDPLVVSGPDRTVFAADLLAALSDIGMTDSGRGDQSGWSS